MRGWMRGVAQGWGGVGWRVPWGWMGWRGLKGGIWGFRAAGFRVAGLEV